jgi:hypothetical protein
MSQETEENRESLIETISKGLGFDAVVGRQIVDRSLFGALVELLIQKGVITKEEMTAIVKNKREIIPQSFTKELAPEELKTFQPYLDEAIKSLDLFQEKLDTIE